jgi:hypothetical protein
MRRFTAIILVICFGILIPAAATPIRICLLDPEERTGDCCRTCSSDSNECCADLAPLPDTSIPNGNFETPSFVGYPIPYTLATLPLIAERIALPSRHARPAAGIGPPTARLAALNVWRL